MENIEEKQQISESDEKVFQIYVEDLRLTPEDFKKRILDIGAGSAQFAKWAKEHGVSSNIYSLEPYQDILEKEKSIRGFAEKLPFADKSFDLIISNSAIPNIYLTEGSADAVNKKVHDSFYEMLRTLKDEGEIRLARVLMGKEFESQKILSQALENTIKDLEKEGLKVEKIKTPEYNTYQYDQNHNPLKILAEAFLIIIRK